MEDGRFTANFKTYIFPLPFFKHICAVHQVATVL